MFKIIKSRKYCKPKYPAVSNRHDRIYINALATDYLDLTRSKVIIEQDEEARLIRITSVPDNTPDSRKLTPIGKGRNVYTIGVKLDIPVDYYPVILSESKLGNYIIFSY